MKPVNNRQNKLSQIRPPRFFKEAAKTKKGRRFDRLRKSKAQDSSLRG